jgi:hypothetical protein
VTRNRYHTPNVPPVTAWAKHLDAVARAEGLSQSGLFRKLRDAVALGPESRTAFRPYLVDKEPDADKARGLAAIVGWPTEPAPDLNPPAGADPPKDPMLVAMERQAEAIENLVLRIDRLLESRDKDLAALALTVGQALQGRTFPDRTLVS